MSNETNGVLVPHTTVFEDLEPQVHYFEIRGKRYVVKSASTGASIKFRNAHARAAKWDVDPSDPQKMRVTGFDGLADAEPLLVQLCTFEVITTAGGEVRHGAVSAGWVSSLPPEITKAMFDKIMELSPCITGTDRRLAAAEANGKPARGESEEGEVVDPTDEPLPKGWPERTTSTSS